MTADPSTPAVELRSDTFTRPTPEMRTAMATAVVGDDVWGEDPTVAALEARVAAYTGKEAALYVPSGTFSNLMAIMTHVSRRNGFLVCGDQAHIFVYEQQGAAVVGGVGIVTLPNTDDGKLPLDALATTLDVPDDPHFATPALVCIEQTDNRCGGSVLPVDHLLAVAAAARKAGVPVHMDGARLANAAAVLGCDDPAAPWARACTGADSVSVCLSKGLGAPVGSCLAGSLHQGRAAHAQTAWRWHAAGGRAGGARVGGSRWLEQSAGGPCCSQSVGCWAGGDRRRHSPRPSRHQHCDFWPQRRHRSTRPDRHLPRGGAGGAWPRLGGR